MIFFLSLIQIIRKMPAVLSKINGAFKGSLVDYIWASKQRKVIFD